MLKLILIKNNVEKRPQFICLIFTSILKKLCFSQVVINTGDARRAWIDLINWIIFQGDNYISDAQNQRRMNELWLSEVDHQ